MVDETPYRDIDGTPADAGSLDFFVSYVPADKEWATWIAWQLEERLRLNGRKPTLFVRAWDVVAGGNEAVGRQRALSACARLVAVLTPDYQASEGAITEWAAVLSGDPNARQVVPVRVKKCRPDGLLRPYEYIDLVDRDEASAVDALLSGISTSIEGRAKPSTAPGYPGAGRAPEDATAGPPPRFPGLYRYGEPPTVPPKWFQDRSAEVEDIERHLDDDRTRLVMVTGREGYGKTAMVHRLWERVPSLLRVHGLVYLSARGFRPVTADSVITGLAEVLPKHEAGRARRPVSAPWVEKLAALLTALAGRKVIIAIDAIEELLNDDEDIAETGLRELVDHLLTRADHGVRLLLVGRRAARAVADRFSGMTYPRNLDAGLPAEDAFALLQAMDADDRLNLGDVEDHDKARLRELTDGSPRTLELAYGVLATEGFSFTRLLEFLARPDGGSTVDRLLGHACERLPVKERRSLQALAVYGRPVVPTAVAHLLRDAVPDPDGDAVLAKLYRLRLAQSDGECFSVPATEERDYLIERLRREPGPGAWNTPEALMHRAADYFAGERNPEPQRLDDLWEHLVEIELRLRAGDSRTAFELMGHVDDRYLHGWGASSALADLLGNLLGHKGIPRKLEIDAHSMLARALMQQGDHQAAAEHLELAFGLASGSRQRNRMIVLRLQLAEAYIRLGDLRHAAEHSRRACHTAIRQVRITNAMTSLAGQATCMARAGQFPGALWRFRVARWMLRRFGTKANQLLQPTLLLGQAWVHCQLGERDRARQLLNESKRRAAAAGNRDLVGNCLLNEAQLALDARRPDQAVRLAEQAWEIGIHNGNRPLCRDAMEILAIAQLAQGDLDAAARSADIAERNRGSVLGYGLVGLVAYRRDKREEAKAAFNKGYVAARKRYRPNESNFQFLDEYGLVACGLALLGEPSCLKTALDVYRDARTITTGRGAVERTQLLLAQFGPHADHRILERVRAVAGGERSDRTL